MGRGRNTHRYHIHIVSQGIPEEVIIAKWGFGKIQRIEHLRKNNRYNGKDYGQDYTGLANYLFDHWEPEQGKHRWKQTKNARQPEKETAKPVKRVYSESKPPKPPKGYVLMETRSNKYGYLYFKYVYMEQAPPQRGHRRN